MVVYSYTNHMAVDISSTYALDFAYLAQICFTPSYKTCPLSITCIMAFYFCYSQYKT